ncbi:dienelactone hydrolase family protein [Ilumatobacter sp.]|uniref:dienelactone hydrolase family protein n=1 Tax=Ilumatobacter sp. TaxID=1967498 RepID=UPI003B51F4E7
MTPSGPSPLEGWVRGGFSAAGITHDTHRRGTGPCVLVIHEVPGITPEVERFANEVVERGFTVVMPELFGTPGRASSAPYAIATFARACVAREFTVLATGRTSPVVAWLRALARSVHHEVGGAGVGAVGMCFTGGFVLGMMVDESMLAPVVSQPSLPLPLGAERAASLGLSPDDEAAVVQRAVDGCQVLGLRYEGDRFVGTRFATLHERLGDAFVSIDLPQRSATDHSVLTEHRDDASVERVLDFLGERLSG